LDLSRHSETPVAIEIVEMSAASSHTVGRNTAGVHSRPWIRALS
jgi:hypothetical protein